MPVSTQPPDAFVSKFATTPPPTGRSNLEPDGALSSADPEYKLSKIEPVVPIAGIFLSLPLT